MQARDHLILAMAGAELGAVTALPAPTSALEVAGWVSTYGAATATAVTCYGWASLAPDLDHESATATLAYAPAPVRSFHDGRLRPNPRFLLRYIVPGSHTLSGIMRLLARWWYYETRGPGDDPGARLTHRGLWHTGPGAVVIAVAVGVLLSPLPGLGVAALLGATDPAVATVVAHGLSAIFVALMGGVAALAWNHKWKGGGMIFGGVAGALSDLTLYWWLWPVAVYLGCWAHCVGDNCTEGRLPRWWAPFGRVDDEGRKWSRQAGWLPRWMLVTTGGGGEALLVILILAAVGFLNWVILSARFDLGTWDLFS